MIKVFRLGGSIGGGTSLIVYSIVIVKVLLATFFSGYSFLLEIRLIKISSFSFTLPILLSWENRLASIVVCVISGCVLIYSKAYMGREENFSRFIILVCLFVLSINLLIFIPSLLFLFLGWDGLGIVSFILVTYYQNKNSLGAGIITVLTNRVGDVFLFLRISLRGCIGYWCWEGLSVASWFIPKTDLFIFCFRLVVAGITKRAQFPFCAWLPEAMAAPTPVSALVHSSTLVTAGVFLLCRFRGVLMERKEVCEFLFMVSLATILLSGLVCCVEWDIKKVIALSTLSQLGFIMFSISLGLISFRFFHLVTHAVFKALLFLCAGFVIRYCNHSQDFRCIRGVWWVRPVVRGCTLTSAFCLGGMPFLRGFYSKDLILEAFLTRRFSIGRAFCFILAMALTVCYRVRLCLIVLVGKGGIEVEWDELGRYYLFSFLVLGVLGIFEGCLIQRVYSPCASFNFVFSFVKNGLSGVLLFRILVGVLLIQITENYYILGSYFLYSFLFIGQLRGQSSTKNILVFGKGAYEVIDQGMFERFLGGHGFSKLVKWVGQKLIKIGLINRIYTISFYFIAIFILIRVFRFLVKL